MLDSLSELVSAMSGTLAMPSAVISLQPSLRTALAGLLLPVLVAVGACAPAPYVLDEDDAARGSVVVFSPVSGQPVGIFARESYADWRSEWLQAKGYREAATGEPGTEWAAMRESMAAWAEDLGLGLAFSDHGVRLWETGPPGAGDPGQVTGRLDTLVARLSERQELLVEVAVGGEDGEGGIPPAGLEWASRLVQAGVPTERVMVKSVPPDAHPPGVILPVLHLIPLEPIY